MKRTIKRSVSLLLSLVLLFSLISGINFGSMTKAWAAEESTEETAAEQAIAIAAEENNEDIADRQWFYLSDFPPMEKVTTGWTNGANYLAINSSIYNTATDGAEAGYLYLCTEKATSSAEAVKFSKGMSIHAPGKITYDISDMKATRFTCLFGPNAKIKSGKGSVGLMIYTDLNAPGEYLYCLNSAEDAARLGVEKFPVGPLDKAVEVDIAIPEGATRLYIEVTNGGNGGDSDVAVFAEPKLYADFAYLSNMQYESASVGYGSVNLDKSVSGPIILNTLYQGSANGASTIKPVTCDEGIGLHAASSITYNIEGLGVKRFTSFCGISTNNGDYNPTTTFKVFFDDVEVHSINKTKKNANIAIGQNIDLQVPEGTKTITLTAKATGSNSGNHTCWAYPRLFGDNVGKVRNLSLVVENEGLFVGKAQEVTVIAESLWGDRKLDAAEVQLTAESDNITIDGNKVTATSGETALLKVEYIKDSVVVFTKTFELNIFNENTSWTVASPDGKSKLTVFLTNGKLFYSAELDGKTYVHMSQLGLKTTAVEYCDGFEFVSATDSCEILEIYDMPSGKFSTYENHCNERIITFQKDGNTFGVVIRAYDDGAAFRYVLGNESDIEISDEATELVMPKSTYVWYQPNTGGKYPNTHEQRFGYGEAEQYTFDITVPFMYKTPDGVNVVVSEADLDGSYCGSVLQSISETKLKFGFPEQQTNEDYCDSPLVLAGANFESPWRAFVAGDEETIFMSTMFENVSDPCVVEDTSWIKAGTTTFSWMTGIASGMHPWTYQGDRDVIMDHIDLVSEMGWDYYLMDAGWMTWVNRAEALALGLRTEDDFFPERGWYVGFYDYTQDLVDYANSKDVGLLVWLHFGQVDDPTNDYEQMDKIFAQIHEYGFKGIKVDFFNSERQVTIQLYNKIYEKAAKYQLLVNLHGSNKPSGERRTYPNVINREAIYAEELNHTLASQMVIQSYVRGLVGPTDLTPYLYPATYSDTTMAQQMAYSVIYESGLQCFGESIDVYRALSDELKEYFYAYPSAWNDSRFISGTIGKDMTIARQSRDGRWYVGGITTSAKKETVVLDFLKEGVTYKAYIYTDNGRESVNFEERTVQKSDSITASLSENGGFAVKIVEDMYAAYVGEQGYETVAGAIDAANGNIVKLVHSSNEAIAISADVTIDLAGKSLSNVTVAGGASLTLIDSANDDYEGECGTAKVTGAVKTFTEANEKTYLVTQSNGVYSAHCYDVAITHISLKADSDALGYKAKLYGDETVQSYVQNFGFNMWVDGGQVKTLGKTGSDVVTLRLKNIMAANGGRTNINATAFVTLAVGAHTNTKISDRQSTAMKSTLQKVNEAWTGYTDAQKTSVKALCDQYSDVVSDWKLDNIYPVASGAPVAFDYETVAGSVTQLEGFTVQNGKLIVPNDAKATGAEAKAILTDTPTGDKTLSVELHPNGTINSGIYLGASNASNARDGINSVVVHVESKNTTDPNRIDVIIGSFPAWTEYHRYVINGSAALFTNGKKEPITLTVVQNGNNLTVTVALVSNPSKSATTTYTYNGSCDLNAGQVGLRSYESNCSFDNFKVITSQESVEFTFADAAQLQDMALYQTWDTNAKATAMNTIALHKYETFTNGTLAMDINNRGTNDAGIVFGADAEGKNYYLYRLTADRYLELVKVNNGVETVLDRGYLSSEHYDHNYNRLEVVKNGNQIACYYYNRFDKINCYTIYEDAQPLTGTRFGFWSKGYFTKFQNTTMKDTGEIRKADVLFFGNEYAEMWPEYETYFPEYDSIDNITISGSTASNWEDLADEIAGYAPKWGVYNIGINDLTSGTSPEAVIASVERTLLAVKESQPQFQAALVSVSHCPALADDSDAISQINALMRNLAAKYDWMHYADAEYLFCTDANDPLSTDESLFIWNGFDLTNNGYQLMADLIRSVID